jgi:uncharacterized RDD family membrane protein YckC
MARLVRVDRLGLGAMRAAARSSRDIVGAEAERAIDALLAGPLPEAVGHSIVEHQVLERIASEMLATAAPDGIAASDLDRALQRVRGSAALEGLNADGGVEALAERFVEQLVQSAAFRRALHDTLASPEVRAALREQSTGYAGDVATVVRTRLRAVDDTVERPARRLFKRRAEAPSRYGGLGTRGVALVVDAALAELMFIVAAGAIALVVALAGGLGSGWLAGTLTGVGWFVVAAAYFVAFWSTTGQTPGMRIMRLRVLARSGAPPSALASLVRFAALILSIIPLFAGFLPALVDSRRRALPDFVARTVVVHEGDEAPVALSE